MSAGASDAIYIRGAGIPTYGVDGIWGYLGEPLGSHGLEADVPVARRRAQRDGSRRPNQLSH